MRSGVGVLIPVSFKQHSGYVWVEFVVNTETTDRWTPTKFIGNNIAIMLEVPGQVALISEKYIAKSFA